MNLFKSYGNKVLNEFGSNIYLELFESLYYLDLYTLLRKFENCSDLRRLYLRINLKNIELAYWISNRLETDMIF